MMPQGLVPDIIFSVLWANYSSKIYDKPNILLIFAENWKHNYYIITNNMVIDDKILDQLIDFFCLLLHPKVVLWSIRKKYIQAV